MAKCNSCGKKGVFLKVNAEGLCINCIEGRYNQIENDYRSLKSVTVKLKATNTSVVNKYNQLRNSYLSLKSFMDKIGATTALAVNNKVIEYKTTCNRLIQKIKELQKHEAGLEATINAKKNEVLSIEEEKAKQQKSIVFNANKLLKLKTIVKSIQYSNQRYQEMANKSLDILGEPEVEVDELLSTTVKLKFNLMDIRELKKRYNLNSKIIQEILVKYQSRYTTKANMSIYRLMVIALEAELQNILHNLKYAKLEKSIKDIKSLTAKYQKIATDGNQNIAPTITKFIGEIEYLFIEAIKIEYEYYIQKERIKEEQREVREKMRQEAAERKRLEDERKKVEAEEEKYKIEIAAIENQLQESKDAVLIKQLEERIKKLQSQLNEVEHKKDDIIRLEHGQAGYIYVISNLGSFGENVFKIGMTRRLNPQDRVDELGDASVPFRFDVHCMIFSNKATELEAQIHKKLHNNRINKINIRKEFFRTAIDEIENIVYNLEPSAEFNRTMLAEQYYQSMAVNEIPERVEIVEDDDFEENEGE